MLGAREDVKIAHVCRVGKQEPKVLVAEFTCSEDRAFILSKSKILRGTQFSIIQDMIPSVRHKHNKLLAVRKQIKLVNKGAKINVRLNNMFIDGLCFHWSEQNGLMLNGENGVCRLNELFKFDFMDCITKLVHEKVVESRVNTSQRRTDGDSVSRDRQISDFISGTSAAGCASPME